MADIELVIKIPEDVFKRTTFYREFRDLNDCITTIKALEKAVSLPKGHGRLGDLDKIYVELNASQIEETEEYKGLEAAKQIVCNAKTIINTDRGEEE